MEPKTNLKKPLQPGYEKVNSPDLAGKERFAESLDRSLTNDLEENDDYHPEKEKRSKNAHFKP